MRPLSGTGVSNGIGNILVNQRNCIMDLLRDEVLTLMTDEYDLDDVIVLGEMLNARGCGFIVSSEFVKGLRTADNLRSMTSSNLHHLDMELIGNLPPGL